MMSSAAVGPTGRDSAALEAARRGPVSRSAHGSSAPTGGAPRTSARAASVRPARSPRAPGPAPSAAQRPQHTDVARQEHVRVGQRAHPDVAGGPRPDARQRQQPGAASVAVRARVAGGCPATRARRPAVTSARAARQRHRQRGRVSRGDRRRVGEEVRQRRRPLGTSGTTGGAGRRPAQRGEPGAEPPRGGDRDLLAEHGPDRDLVAVDRARPSAAPGRPAPAARSPGRPSKKPEIAAGSASRSSSRRQRCTAAVTSRRSASASEQSTQLAPGTGRQARAAAGPFGRLIVLRYVGRSSHLDSGNRPRGQEAEHPRQVDRRPERQPQPQHPGRAAAAAPPAVRAGAPRPVRRRVAAARSRSRVGGVSKTSSIVALNCLMRGEPGRERDVAHRQLRRLDQDPRRPRPLRPGERERPRADLGGQQRGRTWRWRVAEPGRQAVDPGPVHDAVGDQPHRAPGDVRPDVPLRRTGRGVGPAPLAGAEAGLLRRGRRRVEHDVGALRA